MPGQGGALVAGVIWKASLGEMPSRLTLERSEGRLLWMFGRKIPRKPNTKCKGPEREMRTVCPCKGRWSPAGTQGVCSLESTRSLVTALSDHTSAACTCSVIPPAGAPSPRHSHFSPLSPAVFIRLPRGSSGVRRSPWRVVLPVFISFCPARFHIYSAWCQVGIQSRRRMRPLARGLAITEHTPAHQQIPPPSTHRPETHTLWLQRCDTCQGARTPP